MKFFLVFFTGLLPMMAQAELKCEARKHAVEYGIVERGVAVSASSTSLENTIWFGITGDRDIAGSMCQAIAKATACMNEGGSVHLHFKSTSVPIKGQNVSLQFDLRDENRFFSSFGNCEQKQQEIALAAMRSVGSAYRESVRVRLVQGHNL